MSFSSLRRGLLSACVALPLVSAALAVSAQSKTELLVYTALEADQIQAYKKSFEAQNPTIELKIVRDSTGIITAKLLAEKSNPQADIVWGLAATSLMLLDKEGMLAPYAPKGLEKVKASMRDPRTTPSWVGMDVWSSAICFNWVCISLVTDGKTCTVRAALAASSRIASACEGFFRATARNVPSNLASSTSITTLSSSSCHPRRSAK